MCNAGLVCFPEIAERGTQDFSTRLIKHTELGEKARKASHYHLQWSTTGLKYAKVAKDGPASNLLLFPYSSRKYRRSSIIEMTGSKKMSI